MAENILYSKMNIIDKNIKFIKDQHNELVNSLNDEIDKLKHKKRELQFCLLEMIQDHNPTVNLRKMNPIPKINNGSYEVNMFGNIEKIECQTDSQLQFNCQAIKNDSPAQLKDDATRLREIKMLFLEQEAEEYSLLIKKIKFENEKLRRIVKYKQPFLLQKMSLLERVEESKPCTPEDVIPLECEGLLFEVTLDPFLIHDHPPRPPQVEECELILQQLAYINRKQQHELNQLNSDLHDVLNAKSLDIDAYMIARKYIPNFELPKPFCKNPLIINSQIILKEKHPIVSNLIHAEFKNNLFQRNVAIQKSKIQNKKLNAEKKSVTSKNIN